MAYLGDHLAAWIMEWCAELQANQPSAEECPIVPPPLAAELQEVPPPSPKSLLEHVIEGNQEPVIRVTENDRSIEQIDNPDDVLDRQE